MDTDSYIRGLHKKALANLIAGLIVIGIIALIAWLTGAL